MKRIKKMALSSAFLFATILILTGSAFSQSRTDGPEGVEYKDSSPGLPGYGYSFGIDVGTVLLQGDRYSNYDTGIGFGGHFEYYIYDLISLDFATGYSRHNGSAGLGAMNNIFFDLGPRAKLPIDPVTPFLSVSPGFVWQSFGAPVSDSAFAFAIDFGTGLDLLVSDHVTMGLTYKYHLVFDTNTSTPAIGTGDFHSIMFKIDLVF